MKPRLRLIAMAVLAAVAAALFSPPDGSAPMTFAQPLLIMVAILVYLPIVLVPAVLMPTRIMKQRWTVGAAFEVLARTVPLAFIVAVAEAYAISLKGGVQGVTFLTELALSLGAVVTVLFSAQLLMLLLRNRENGPPNRSLERSRDR
jgi:hypothetical protein